MATSPTLAATRGLPISDAYPERCRPTARTGALGDGARQGQPGADGGGRQPAGLRR